MKSRSLFLRGNEVVRDLNHVRVERFVEVASGGKSFTLYRKFFKHKGWDVWSDRENRFLSLFHGGDLRHVVQMRKLEAITPGDVSSVETHDAGLTIEEWLQVLPHYADGTSFAHPFRRGEDFVRLLRACLVALKEIHDFGVVHCDVKQDNICLPYTPRPYQADGMVMPDFAEIRLIDFSFSLGRDQPLKQRLPIEPSAAYQSPLLKVALAADMQSGKPTKTAQLDYKVDLYGLGFMGQQIMASGSFYWDSEERGASGKALLREVIDDLLAIGAGKSLLRLLQVGKPHERLISKLDSWLQKARPQEAFYPQAQSPTPAPATGTPVTPLNTPVTPVVIPLPEQAQPEAGEQTTAPQTKAKRGAEAPVDEIPSDKRPGRRLKPAHLALVVAVAALAGGGYWWKSQGDSSWLAEPTTRAEAANPTPSKTAQPTRSNEPAVAPKPVPPTPPPLAQRASTLAEEMTNATGSEAEYARLLKSRSLDAGEEPVLAAKTLKALWSTWFSNAKDAATTRRREAALAPLLWLLVRQSASEQIRLRAELGARYWQDSNAGPMQAEWWNARGPRAADAVGRAWLSQTTQLAHAGIFAARIALAEAQYAGKGQATDNIAAAASLSAALLTLNGATLSDKGTTGPLKDAMGLSKLGLGHGKAFADALRPGLEHLASLGHANGRFLLGGLLSCTASDPTAGRRVFAELAKDAGAAGATEFAARAGDALTLLDAKDQAGLCSWLEMKP